MPDCMDWNFQCVKSIITIIVKILFNSSPKKFYEVQFTMELWENETEVASSFNGLLHEWFLSLEVWLILKDLFVAAILQNTFFVTFPAQITLVESPLCENSLDSLWHVGVLRVWRRIYHGLSDFLILNKLDWLQSGSQTFQTWGSGIRFGRIPKPKPLSRFRFK